MSALQASALGWTSDATERRIAPTEVMRKIALWFTGQKRFPKVFLTKSCSGMQVTTNFWLQSHPILKTLWRYMWTLATIMWTTLTLIFLISIQYHGDHHQVNVTISIVDIMEIDELAEKFTIKFNFQRDWFDHRLTYLNLKVKGRIVLWDLKSAEGSLAWSQRSDNRWGNDTLVSGHWHWQRREQLCHPGDFYQEQDDDLPKQRILLCPKRLDPSKKWFQVCFCLKCTKYIKVLIRTTVLLWHIPHTYVFISFSVEDFPTSGLLGTRIRRL